MTPDYRPKVLVAKFDVTEDMTPEELESILGEAFDYAAEDYSDCLEASRGDESEEECYQAKIDNLEKIQLRSVEPVEEIDDYWAEDPDYPLDNWRYEITNDDTRQGYHDWVKSQKEMEEEDGSTDNH